MAFWRLGNGFNTTSPIDKILDSNDHTLIDVLKEPEILQELVAPNTKLVEYLREPDTMRQLVKLITDVQTLNSQSSEEAASTDEQTPASPTPASGNNDDDDDSRSTPATTTTTSNDDTNDKNTPQDSNDSNDTPNDKSTNEPNNKDDNDEESDTPADSSSTMPADNDTKLQDSDDSTSTQQEDSSLESESESESEQESESDLEEDDEDDSYLDEANSTQHYAHVASEILSAEVWSITESFMAFPELLDELWKVLDYVPPLSMAYANYFTKINEALLDRKTDEMLTFIKSQDNFVQRFMKHIDNPPLMDFLLKVISSDKPDSPTGIIEVCTIFSAAHTFSNLSSFCNNNVSFHHSSPFSDPALLLLCSLPLATF